MAAFLAGCAPGRMEVHTMFEDSLVASRVGQIPTAKRWAIFGAASAQCVLAALAIALPLLHPTALPFEIATPRVLAPVLPKQPAPVRMRQVQNVSSAPAVATTSATRPLLPSLLPRQGPAGDPPPAEVPFGSGMGNSIPAALGMGDGHGVGVSVAPARMAGPVRVSKGVSEGMLLSPIRPVYPAIAQAAGIQGTVVVEAVISRTGTIEGLRVVSGPTMLQAAALEAIRAARYRPYRLNGEPTEVQTTITVNFRMGS